MLDPVLPQDHPRLLAWGLRDLSRGEKNLQQLAAALPPDLLAPFLASFDRFLPSCPDPDMALNNLERFLAHESARNDCAAMLDPSSASPLDFLILLLSTSQYLSEILIAQPSEVKRLTIPLRNSPTKDELVQGLLQAIPPAADDAGVQKAIRQFRQREMLRIGANDILRDRPLEEITQDISHVAEAAVEAAFAIAARGVAERMGAPVQFDGTPGRCVVFAFGKLGGQELNYSSDIDLMILFGEEGQTQGRKPYTLSEYYARVTTQLVKLLSEHPPAYRVDLRLRPEGERGPLARSFDSTLAYYDTMGRTWERQALIKVRPIAGDMDLGEAFLQAVEPFVFRQYLTYSEINDIKATKRRIERRALQAGENNVDVKTGHGGIRDVEFIIQFLQLLNGGVLPQVRKKNTLQAIQALVQTGCLTDQESAILEDTYRFLRKTEHRLQLMFDLQTHRLPVRDDELNKLALRMGYPHTGKTQTNRVPEPTQAATGGALPAANTLATNIRMSALYDFCNDYKEKTAVNRTILNHLLHETFTDDAKAEPEADLILDPDPDAGFVQEVLGRYRFKDVKRAYRNLVHLATESVPFLSTPRCRHFLANCAAPLLRALAETPDPDMALNNLEKVTDSLGAKGVLWELFTFNPPSLKLLVELCAWSEFLSQILINNPGMSDELLDSLVLNQPRSLVDLQQELLELCKGATDLDLILHSFQDKELLRIGVNDMLGKESLQATFESLSNLAEVMLQITAEREYEDLRNKWGEPRLGDSGSRTRCRYALLAMGKLGGREMNYQSDLDLVLLYEGDGTTAPLTVTPDGETARRTDNFHFFSELGRAIIQKLSHSGPRGKLYAVDMRLRPTGKSGSLATTLPEFRRYHAEGLGQFWERLALTRARVVAGDELVRETIHAAHDAAYAPAWKPAWLDELLDMRRRLEESRGERDLKRGVGGSLDIEFLVQFLQVKHGGAHPALRQTNTWKALDILGTEQLLPANILAEVKANYEFLRRVESRLRIVHNLASDELPENPEEREKLARRLGYVGTAQPASHAFLQELDFRTKRTRELFLQCLERERQAAALAPIVPSG